MHTKGRNSATKSKKHGSWQNLYIIILPFRIYYVAEEGWARQISEKLDLEQGYSVILITAKAQRTSPCHVPTGRSNSYVKKSGKSALIFPDDFVCDIKVAE